MILYNFVTYMRSKTLALKKQFWSNLHHQLRNSFKTTFLMPTFISPIIRKTLSYNTNFLIFGSKKQFTDVLNSIKNILCIKLKSILIKIIHLVEIERCKNTSFTSMSSFRSPYKQWTFVSQSL